MIALPFVIRTSTDYCSTLVRVLREQFWHVCEVIYLYIYVCVCVCVYYYVCVPEHIYMQLHAIYLSLYLSSYLAIQISSYPAI